MAKWVGNLLFIVKYLKLDMLSITHHYITKKTISAKSVLRGKSCFFVGVDATYSSQSNCVSISKNFPARTLSLGTYCTLIYSNDFISCSWAGAWCHKKVSNFLEQIIVHCLLNFTIFFIDIFHPELQTLIIFKKGFKQDTYFNLPTI